MTNDLAWSFAAQPGRKSEREWVSGTGEKINKADRSLRGLQKFDLEDCTMKYLCVYLPNMHLQSFLSD